MKENKFKNYTIKLYEKDIDDFGLNKLWDKILEHIFSSKNIVSILEISNLGELYEYGLAYSNKTSKKELGKYYTPNDVSSLMSEWLIPLKGKNICDICSGTGNLILSYLSKVNKKEVESLLENKQIYLYDIDKTALKIAQYSIALSYGKKYLNNIHIYNDDFLKDSITLPKDSKVISNPPYYKIEEFSNEWNLTENIKSSKEFYSSIMEKIIKQSESSVIITPYSFISSNKFFELRKVLNNYNGFIISFDNVPGNIFNGRKHGIFNTNTSNSVRASITITENKKNIKGYRISPLIRFKNIERERLLKTDILENTLSSTYQLISNENKSYYKCFSNLEDVYLKWSNVSNKTLNNFISKKETSFKLNITNTCRYQTVASMKDLNRTGKHILYFNNKEDMNFVYLLFNSSFAYFFWRMYDGGITYPLYLIKNLPVFKDSLSKKSKNELKDIMEEMISNEKDFLVYKKNSHKMQENIKFPDIYRKKINTIFLKELGFHKDLDILDILHKNNFFD